MIPESPPPAGPSKPTGRRQSLLSGSALFLALVVYFNLRAEGSPQTEDWVVMGLGLVAFSFALVRWVLERRRGQTEC